MNKPMRIRANTTEYGNTEVMKADHVDEYIAHLEAKRSEAEHRLQLVRLQRDKAAAPNVYLRPFGEDAQKTFCICEPDHPFSIPARLMKGDDDE